LPQAGNLSDSTVSEIIVSHFRGAVQHCHRNLSATSAATSSPSSSTTSRRRWRRMWRG